MITIPFSDEARGRRCCRVWHHGGIMKKMKWHDYISLSLNVVLIGLILGVGVSLIWGGFTLNFRGVSLTVLRLSKPVFYIMSLLYLKYLISPAFRDDVDRFFINLVQDLRKLILVLILLLLVAGGLILCHFVFPQYAIWNLDLEIGHATAFSGWILFNLVIVGTVIYRREKSNTLCKFQLWLPIILLFFYLSFDEVFSIHEWLPAPAFIQELSKKYAVIERFDWLRMYIPIFLAVGIYLIYFMFNKIYQYKSVFIIMGLGGFVYALAIGSEMIMMQLNLRQSIYHNMQLASEEGLEMLGTILFLSAFLIYLRVLIKQPVIFPREK